MIRVLRVFRAEGGDGLSPFGRVLGQARATVHPEPGQVVPVLVPAVDEQRHVGSPLDVADARERGAGRLSPSASRRSGCRAPRLRGRSRSGRGAGARPRRSSRAWRSAPRRRSWPDRRSTPYAHAAGTDVCFKAPVRCFHSCGSIAPTVPLSATVPLRWKHLRRGLERTPFRHARVSRSGRRPRPGAHTGRATTG